MSFSEDLIQACIFDGDTPDLEEPIENRWQITWPWGRMIIEKRDACAWFLDLQVDEEHQGRGIIKHLTQHLTKPFRDIGCTNFGAIIINKKAQDILENIGFKIGDHGFHIAQFEDIEEYGSR